ncbi:hypothetical protein CHU98_g9820 [Xylaria longipes]|nr:hypothetical protein CHU98_g9820 [Xylaria longipes]
MQRLAAPAREDIDRAHDAEKPMKIGSLALANFAVLSKKRLGVFFLLWASSLPLHLLFNSVVVYTSTNAEWQSYVFLASEEELESLMSNTSALAISGVRQYNATTKFEQASLEDNPFLQEQAILRQQPPVVDLRLDAASTHSTPDLAKAGATSSSCTALKAHSPQSGRSNPLFGTVISPPLTKTHGDGCVGITTGTQRAMRRKSWRVAGICRFSRLETQLLPFWKTQINLCHRWGRLTYHSRRRMVMFEMKGAFWAAAIFGVVGLSRAWWFFAFTFRETAVAFPLSKTPFDFDAMLRYGVGKMPSRWSYTLGENLLSYPGAETPSFTYTNGAVLSNLPQLALSAFYLVFNNYVTRLFIALEFRSFSTRRRGLRYSLLSIALFALLHTFLPQTLFLRRVYAIYPQSYDVPGEIGKKLLPMIGYSPVAGFAFAVRDCHRADISRLEVVGYQRKLTCD